MKKYEYKIVNEHIESLWHEKDFLNGEGDNGWELVQVQDNNTNTFTYYFKREKI